MAIEIRYQRGVLAIERKLSTSIDITDEKLKKLVARLIQATEEDKIQWWGEEYGDYYTKINGKTPIKLLVQDYIGRSIFKAKYFLRIADQECKKITDTDGETLETAIKQQLHRLAAQKQLQQKIQLETNLNQFLDE